LPALIFRYPCEFSLQFHGLSWVLPFTQVFLLMAELIHP
jgi:hypothetical protein